MNEPRPSPTVPQLSTLFEKISTRFGTSFPLCSECLLKKIVVLEVNLEDQIVEEVNYSNMLKRMEMDSLIDEEELKKEISLVLH